MPGRLTETLRALSLAGLAAVLLAGLDMRPAAAQPAGWGGGMTWGGGMHWGGGAYPSPYHHYHRPRYRPPAYYVAPPYHYRYYRYDRRYRHHYDPFAAGLGLGILGGIIATRPYHGHAYSPGRRDYCHVHLYKVPGMTFHRDVRCFKHKNWTHPSIRYVR